MKTFQKTFKDRVYVFYRENDIKKATSIFELVKNQRPLDAWFLCYFEDDLINQGIEFSYIFGLHQLNINIHKNKKQYNHTIPGNGRLLYNVGIFETEVRKNE